MKKLVIILMFALIGTTVSYAQSMIKVSTADKQVINVAVDSRYFNKRGTSVTVGDLPAGRHFLSIYGIVRKRRGKMKEAVIYEGNIITYNGMISIIVHNPSNNTNNVHSEDISEYLKHNTILVDDPVVTRSNTNSASRRYDNSRSNTESNTLPNTDAGTPSASPVTLDDMSTLTDNKIDDLKAKVEEKKTDTEKMKVLKDGLKNEKIASNQVIMLSAWLNFESTKLELAKWAYTICSDPENYNTVGTLFSMAENKNDFDAFMKAHK